MQKRFKTVSMMLFLMGAISGTAYAAPSLAAADDVKITQQSNTCNGVVMFYTLKIWWIGRNL